MATPAKFPRICYAVTFNGSSIETAYSVSRSNNPAMAPVIDPDKQRPTTLYVAGIGEAITVYSTESNQALITPGTLGTLVYKLKDAADSPVDVTVSITNVKAGATSDSVPGRGGEPTRTNEFYLLESSVVTLS